jgi:hypothetical protein
MQYDDQFRQIMLLRYEQIVLFVLVRSFAAICFLLFRLHMDLSPAVYGAHSEILE